MNTFISDMIILKTLILLIVFPGIVLFYVPYEIVTSSSIATFRLGILCYTAVITWLFVVFYEEPTLRKKFGDSYKRFSQRVPRWIPRVLR
jgi:protein-S-isoprenylcysteine O-methyltransferase Ste14